MNKTEDMYDLCVFKGCPNKTHTLAHAWGKALFPFPHSTTPTFEIWLENCGNKAIIGRSEPAISKFGLCSDHFTPDSFYDEGRKKLRRDAVPEPYSQTFKRPYPLARANTRIYDHNYALVPNGSEKTLTSYSQKLFPLSSDTLNDNKRNSRAKTTLGRPRLKRETPLVRTYARKNLNVGKNNGGSSSNDSVANTNSLGLRAAANSALSSEENISANRRGRPKRRSRGGSGVQGNSPQVGVTGLRNGEVGILQETNEELRAQNKLLKKLNGQLKLKMKRSEDRNSMLKMMLEKVSSVDGFLDLHRCTKLDVRNLIKEEIRKGKIKSESQ